MSGKNKKAKTRSSYKAVTSRIEKMLERMDAYRVKVHLTKKQRKS